ncbi:MAG: hypothetical protein ACI4W6_04190 [Acutalibacteraceae bacterium]
MIQSFVLVETVDGESYELEADRISEESGLVYVKNGREIVGIFQAGLIKYVVVDERKFENA